MKSASDVEIQWLGHSTFHILTPEHKRILIDPWVMHNPACPDSYNEIDRLDLMLITHGHFDHIQDAVEIAKATQPSVVANFELCAWLESKGVTNTIAMNLGGSHKIDKIQIMMVHADHSCGIQDNGQMLYGGHACGYLIKLENGFKIYHAGDTGLFGDMRLIGQLYKPDLAMLPIGDRFTMSPRAAAHALKWLKVRFALPMHYGTFPELVGTPDRLRAAADGIQGLEILSPEPGETLRFSFAEGDGHTAQLNHEPVRPSRTATAGKVN